MLGNDTYTKLLLHGNGTDASTTITDSSASGHTVTANGNAQLDTAQKVFGTASILFDGAGDYLTIPDHADFNISGNFTIDGWFRFASFAAAQALVSQYTSDASRWRFSVGNANTITLDVDELATMTFTSSAGLSINTWYHIAFVRSGTTITCYVNGVSVGSVTHGSSLDRTGSLVIGARNYSTGYAVFLNGWIDEFRLSNGVARTDFIPTPIEEYNDSIVAAPAIATGSVRLISMVSADPAVATGSFDTPVATGIIEAVLLPAIIEITGELTSFGEVIDADAINTIPMARCEAGTGAYGYCTIPMASCEATAITNISADAECRIPMASCEGRTGAIAECTIPMATCEATALHHPVADGECRIPMALCEATGVIGAVADALCRIPMAQCEGYAFASQEAYGECLIPMAICEAAATAGSVAWGSCTIPMASVEATSWANPDVDGYCTIPMAICEAYASNQKRNQNFTLQYSRW